MQTLSALTATNFRNARWLVVVLVGITAFVVSGCSSGGETGTNEYRCYYDYAVSKGAQPTFDAELFWSPDSFQRNENQAGDRLDVYVSVKKSRLGFEKEDSTYRASYVCTIRLIKGDETPITKEIDRTLRQNTFPSSSDNSYDAFLQSFQITSGDYSAEISMSDQRGSWKTTKVYHVNIPETSGENSAMGSILLLARYDSSGAGQKITPFILPNAGLLPDTINFFTVVASKSESLDSVSFRLYNLRTRFAGTANMNFQAYVSQQMRYDPCSYGTDTVLVCNHSTASRLNAGYTFIFGAIPRPAIGNYLLKVSAHPAALRKRTGQRHGFDSVFPCL